MVEALTVDRSTSVGDICLAAGRFINYERVIECSTLSDHSYNFGPSPSRLVDRRRRPSFEHLRGTAHFAQTQRHPLLALARNSFVSFAATVHDQVNRVTPTAAPPLSGTRNDAFAGVNVSPHGFVCWATPPKATSPDRQ